MEEKDWYAVPSPPCSPCQLRRQSDLSERPEGGRGGCSRNRRGPDTNSESSAVKKVADGTSGQKDQLRLPGSEIAMATTASVAAGHRVTAGCFCLPRLSLLATAAEAAGNPASAGSAHAQQSNPVAPTSLPRAQAAGSPVSVLCLRSPVAPLACGLGAGSGPWVWMSSSRLQMPPLYIVAYRAISLSLARASLLSLARARARARSFSPSLACSCSCSCSLSILLKALVESPSSYLYF